MASPSEQGSLALKRVACYLLGAPRLVQRFVRQKPVSAIHGQTDADFAGCLRTRASTGCAVIRHARHLIKMISATQKAISLSSAESEYYSLVRGAAASIGAANMTRDLGRELAVRLSADASAAIGIAGRRGAGRVLHFWIWPRCGCRSM